ncbi:MAG TPA: hypothetical protein VJ464_22295 [Blastocatellia bacterium]|nr:hypothetical protein [Blastocatellia bacterium]
MFELKTISREAIPHSLEKAERYRLLNEPAEAESICLDILRVEPENQQALVMLLLALTDQFGSRMAESRPRELLSRLEGEYQRAYYAGIISERKARAQLHRGLRGAEYAAYDGLREAMSWYEKAEALRPPGNDDAALRWNACARTIMDHRLVAKTEDDFRPLLE